MEIVIAIVGACIAVGSAVASGIAGRRIAAEIERVSSTSAALNVELQRRDRFFDLANRSREHADHSLVFLHLLTESKSWIFAAIEGSIQNALYDALAFGHSAVTSADPDAGATREYKRLAHSIVELERAIALGVLRTRDDIAKAANAHAWAEFKAARKKQVTDYWQGRHQILLEQGELKTNSTRLGSRRERISNLALGLQILGLMVILAKDLLS